ncbi:MAG: hypothetical protein ACRD3N_16190 [Terracidiphilus sp.]
MPIPLALQPVRPASGHSRPARLPPYLPFSVCWMSCATRELEPTGSTETMDLALMIMRSGWNSS